MELTAVPTDSCVTPVPALPTTLAPPATLPSTVSLQLERPSSAATTLVPISLSLEIAAIPTMSVFLDSLAMTKSALEPLQDKPAMPPLLAVLDSTAMEPHASLSELTAPFVRLMIFALSIITARTPKLMVPANLSSLWLKVTHAPSTINALMTIPAKKESAPLLSPILPSALPTLLAPAEVVFTLISLKTHIASNLP